MYTIVGSRTDPSKSSGWTAVIMDRGSQFLVKVAAGMLGEELVTVQHALPQFWGCLAHNRSSDCKASIRLVECAT